MNYWQHHATLKINKYINNLLLPQKKDVLHYRANKGNNFGGNYFRQTETEFWNVEKILSSGGSNICLPEEIYWDNVFDL